ncbi:gamma-glutamyltransferase, partial [Salmonella enterica subsp. enterica serovar Montevideo]|nr:gamma-glutamyltransferase [Salmonella enterica subsp. enterica serovar Montevideo]
FIAIKSDDTRHAGFHARRQHFNALSDFDATRRQSAGIPPKIKNHENSKAIFWKDGGPLKKGDKLVQKNLAKSLEMIAENGPDAF